MPTRLTPKTRLAAVGLSALLLAGLEVGADFSQGVAAYNNGNFTKAADEFLIAAEKGDIRAQLNLGLLYDQGQGVEQDYAQAAHWYTRAADSGDAVAQSNLAAMYFQGLGVVQDDAKAAKWYGKAARAGNPVAQYNLAVLYGEGIGVAANLVQSYVWLQIAAANGAQVSDKERTTLTKLLSESQLEIATMLIDAYSEKTPAQEEDN